MKNTKVKKKLSVLLAVIMILSFMHLTSTTSYADSTSLKSLNINTALSRIKEVSSKLNGKYFTVNQSYCYAAPGVSGHGCSNCSNANVIASTWFKNLFSKVPTGTSIFPRFNDTSGGHYSSPAQSCIGFACFAAWYVAADSSSEDIGHQTRHPGYTYISFTASNVRNYAKPGDIIYGSGGHAIVFIEMVGDSIRFIDCNGTRNTYGNCYVSDRTATVGSMSSLMGSNISITGCYNPIGNLPSGGGTLGIRIFNITVSDISSSGYTVYCHIDSNGNTINRVQFPTWSNKNGQDDLASNWTTSSNVRGICLGSAGTGFPKDVYRYMFNVKTSDHNYETGLYTTHIYVWISGYSEAQVCEAVSVNVHSHNYSWVTDKSATCTSSGQKHQHCSICGENTNYTTISALGHDYSWVTDYSATCTSSGQKHQHCSRCGNNANYTSISALGHAWNTPTYSWSSDYSKCTATSVCSRDSSHKETETVNTTSVTTESTYEKTGKIVYTAKFSNSAFSTQTKTVTLPVKMFPDVAESAWYFTAVQYNAERGYITGYSNGKFGPGDTLKRQDFVVILARIAGANLDSYKNSTGGLKDVVKGSYYAPAVAWAVDNEIVTGYANGKFGVGDSITREQVATILYRYMGEPTITATTRNSVLSPYADKGKISSYALNAMAWAVKNGVISGKKPDTLAPTATASRAEIATIVMRMDKAGMFAA